MAIPRNPLHRLHCFHPLLDRYGRAQGPLSVVHDSHTCKGTLSNIQLNENLTLPGLDLYLLGICLLHNRSPHASHPWNQPRNNSSSSLCLSSIFRIAIWNRNIIVSLIAVGFWLGGLALHIRSLTIVNMTYIVIVNTCVTLHTRRGIVSALGVLVVDIVLLLTMLIGLLRHAQKSSIGIWKLLYQQCIIWLALAFLAEIPPVVGPFSAI